MGWKSDEERRAYMRAYYLANREKLLKQQRTYYEAHRDHYRQQFQEHWRANRPSLSARKKARYAADPEPTKAQSREWRSQNPERVTTQNRVRGKKFQAARIASPWKELLHAARWRAKKKGVPFTLTADWAEVRWTGQCEITGISFVLGKRKSGPKFFSPSIDRIDAVTGYVPENCRFVLWAVNSFKHDATDADMLFVARAIVERMGK